MNDLDEILKNKAKKEQMNIPKQLDEKIENILMDLPKKTTKKRSVRVASIVAIMTIVTTATVIAAPYIIELTGGIIDYFKTSKDLKYISDKVVLEKYNSEVGASTTEKEITLTIDNIAVDDNFINLFYTIESEKPIPKRGAEGTNHWSAFFAAPSMRYKINGEYIQPTNIYDTDAYYESDHVLKGMQRFNVSQVKILENFELEVYTQEIFGVEGNWNIPLRINTSTVKANTVMVNPNVKATVSDEKFKHDITVEKVIMSPLGNQMIISQKTKGNVIPYPVFSIFALQDDKGNFLDIYPSIVRLGGPNDIATNSFEFEKTITDTEYLIITPIEFKNDLEIDNKEAQSPKIISEDISKDNIKLKDSDIGTIHIENIEITDTSIKIEYRTEGVVPIRSSFLLLDENGGHVGPDSFLDDKINRQTGVYTITKTFINPTHEEISKIKRIGIYPQGYKLNYDNQIKIPLK